MNWVLPRPDANSLESPSSVSNWPTMSPNVGARNGMYDSIVIVIGMSSSAGWVIGKNASAFTGSTAPDETFTERPNRVSALSCTSAPGMI